MRTVATTGGRRRALRTAALCRTSSSHRRCGATIVKIISALGVTAILTLSGAQPATAHPLGNFTVNRYARVEVSAGAVRVYYVLDEAEIPTFQEGTGVNTDPGRSASSRAADLVSHLRMAIDGVTVPLATGPPRLVLLPGQAGLKTLHLTILFSTSLPSGKGPFSLDFSDTNQPDHIGWREIIVVARGDATIRTSTAPAADISRELTAYPGNLIQSPLDLRHVTATFDPGTQAVNPVSFIVPGKAVARAGAGFAALINRKKVTGLVLVGLLLLAAGSGPCTPWLPGTVRRSWLRTSSVPKVGPETPCYSGSSFPSCIRRAC